MSVGVKVTFCDAVPTDGAVVGVVKAKLPMGVDAPPLKAELASVWPRVMAVAVGQVVTLGVVLFTVSTATLLVSLPKELVTTTL